MKISFDFDGTLEFKEVQDFAKELVDIGYNVCILTTRYSNPMSYKWAKNNPKIAKTVHDPLYAAAKYTGITEINFTEYEWKTTKIDLLNIDIHLDDNINEVNTINKNNKAIAIEYNLDWKNKLNSNILKLSPNSRVDSCPKLQI